MIVIVEIVELTEKEKEELFDWIQKFVSILSEIVNVYDIDNVIDVRIKQTEIIDNTIDICVLKEANSTK